MKHIIGLDLGQSQDYSALVVAEKILPPPPPLMNVEVWGLSRAPAPPTHALAYHLRHIQRFPLGTSYPAIVTAVKGLTEKLVSSGETVLAMDLTGCGRPVFDMFNSAKMPCIAYGLSI